MKRQLKTVQIKISVSAFEALRQYKDLGGLLNLSEAVETMIEHMHTPTAENIQAQHAAEQAKQLTEQRSFNIESNHAMPSGRSSLKITNEHGIPEPFSSVALRTLKKMNVGDSVLVSTFAESVAFRKAASKIRGGKVVTKATDPANNKLGEHRVWRSA